MKLYEINEQLERLLDIGEGRMVDEETGESLYDVEKVLGHISIETRNANGRRSFGFGGGR